MSKAKVWNSLNWWYIVLVLIFLYLPLIPPILFSLSGSGVSFSLKDLTFRWYTDLWNQSLLITSTRTTLILGMITALVTPLLGLLATMAVRELRVPRLILMIILLPLFIPGVSMGLATAFFSNS